jgi:hypothetical protein
MALTYGFSSARSLYEKLQRDAEALKEEVNSDRFFNFVVTGYSLIDWVKEDTSVPQKAKTAVKKLYGNRWIKVCGDLATASKHFSVTSRTPITLSATSEQRFGIGRFGRGRFGVGEKRIEVKLTDNSSFNCFDLVKSVMNTWYNFFSSHGI